VSGSPSVGFRPVGECQWDVVALGEVMLRLDPGEGRIRAARNFAAWEGGGEYNVARGLSRVFGQRATVVTALARNEIGRLIESLILAGGVDSKLIQWAPYDGIGLKARNGLNFTERGFSVRGAVGVSDRAHTAVSQMRLDEDFFDGLFAAGVRLLHTGGIYAALSKDSAATCLAAVKAAHRHGVVVSYDLNYRPSLWRHQGGAERAQAVNRELAAYVDIMLGNEEDFSAALGFEVPGTSADFSLLAAESYGAMITEVVAAYPNLKVVATTLRSVKSASFNDWGALAWSRETGLVPARQRDGLERLDRVGGGDSFASGLLWALGQGFPLQQAVNWGAAHGAYAMTTPGDTSQASLEDVKKLVEGGSARVVR
jgi:2-dehydro-3-deoxygluconokinase